MGVEIFEDTGIFEIFLLEQGLGGWLELRSQFSVDGQLSQHNNSLLYESTRNGVLLRQL
jgi:hypothetical protein